MRYMRFPLYLSIIYLFYSCNGDFTIYEQQISDMDVKIMKNLGNATMAAYLSIYIDGDRLYDERCNPDCTIEKVESIQDTIVVITKVEDSWGTYRDTIMISTLQKE